MRRIITAVFADRAAAKQARQALRDLGLPADRIGMHDDPRRGTTPATDDAPGGESGLPALLDTLFLPHEDFVAHREALRRGGAVVTAEVEEREAAAVARALDEAGARDLDAEVEGWKRQGWSPATMAGAVHDSPGATPAAMPGTGGMDAEAARMLATGSLAPNTTGDANPVTPREGSQDPRMLARREPPIGRARSYVIEAPLAEEGDR
jgi:hypothetical protein